MSEEKGRIKKANSKRARSNIFVINKSVSIMDQWGKQQRGTECESTWMRNRNNILMVFMCMWLSCQMYSFILIKNTIIVYYYKREVYSWRVLYIVYTQILQKSYALHVIFARSIRKFDFPCTSHGLFPHVSQMYNFCIVYTAHVSR